MSSVNSAPLTCFTTTSAPLSGHHAAHVERGVDAAPQLVALQHVHVVELRGDVKDAHLVEAVVPVLQALARGVFFLFF